MANRYEPIGGTSVDVRRHMLGQCTPGLQRDSSVSGVRCDKIRGDHVGSEQSSVDFVNESAGLLRDPVELLKEIIGCGVSPDGAVTVAQSYYAAVGQVCPQVRATSVTRSVSSRGSSRRRMRTLQWQQDMLTLPDTPGQCYLQVVRFGRRRSLLRVLGQNPKLRDFVTALGHDALDMVAARRFNVYKLPTPVGSVAAYHVAEEYDGCCVGTVYDVLARVLVALPSLNLSLRLPSPCNGNVVVDLDGVVGWSALLPDCGRRSAEVTSSSRVMSGISLPFNEMPYKPTTHTPNSRMYLLPQVGLGACPFKEKPACAFGPLESLWSLVVVRGPCEVFTQGYRFSVDPALPVFFLAPRGSRFLLWYFDWLNRPPNPVYTKLEGSAVAQWFLRFGIADASGGRGAREAFSGVVACSGLYAQGDQTLAFGEHLLAGGSVARLGGDGLHSVQVSVVAGSLRVDSCVHVGAGQAVCYLDLGSTVVGLRPLSESTRIQVGRGPVYRYGSRMCAQQSYADRPRGWWSWF